MTGRRRGCKRGRSRSILQRSARSSSSYIGANPFAAAKDAHASTVNSTCCNVEVQLFWSPYDPVPNQGLRFAPKASRVGRIGPAAPILSAELTRCGRLTVRGQPMILIDSGLAEIKALCSELVRHAEVSIRSRFRTGLAYQPAPVWGMGTIAPPTISLSATVRDVISRWRP